MPTSSNSSVTREGQKLTTDNLVSLYLIDLSTIGISTQFAFTNGRDKDLGNLVFRGVTYVPTDIECSGFELASGTLPRPKISISNVTRVMSSASILYDDLIGARFVRTRTYRKFLDNGETPDTAAAYSLDIYSFDKKISHNKQQIEWELAAAMDQEGRVLPGRTLLKNICMWRYRKPVLTTDGQFLGWNYDGVQCPYTGSQAYDKAGNPTSPQNDVPGRHVNDCCKVRFGVNGELPFGGFPGINKTRI